MSIRVEVNKENTYKSLVDLDSFLKIVFPNNELHQEIAKAIIEYLVEHKQAYLMTELIPYIREVKKIKHDKVTYPKEIEETIVSKDTIAKVFKMMWRSGLISKPYRYYPVKLSKVFSSRLRDLADYWERYVDKYG